MKKTFLLLEFKTIGSGFIILDEITKNYNVKIEKVGILCPGRYMIFCSGIHGEIEDLNVYLESLNNKNVNKILVNGVNEDILKSLNKPIKIDERINSLGLVECVNTIKAIEIADFLLDESQIEIISIRMGVGMFDKGVVIFSGNTSDIKNCIDKIKRENYKEVITVEYINSPSKNFLEIFKI